KGNFIYFICCSSCNASCQTECSVAKALLIIWLISNLVIAAFGAYPWGYSLGRITPLSTSPLMYDCAQCPAISVKAGFSLDTSIKLPNILLNCALEMLSFGLNVPSGYPARAPVWTMSSMSDCAQCP